MTELNTNWAALHGDRFRGADVLVTGGAGFIGSHIVEALAALGQRTSTATSKCRTAQREDGGAVGSVG